MKLLQTNIFKPITLAQGEHLQVIDVFSTSGKKIIELSPHSSLTYLVVGSAVDIDIQIVTTGHHCSCKVFGLFASDASHFVTGGLNVSLNHSETSADIEFISFLYDGAKVAIDGTIAIGPDVNGVHGRLLEQNIVLGKNVSLKTLPNLFVASHNVRASHGANVDTLDPQKLFYMMSRGLTKKESQALLVDGYINYALSHFKEIDDENRQVIANIMKR